jgi:hypothetical protein
LQEKLQKAGIKASRWFDNTIRSKNTGWFLNDDCQVVVLLLLGMESNVRWVIHYNLPKHWRLLSGDWSCRHDGLPSETIYLKAWRCNHKKFASRPECLKCNWRSWKEWMNCRTLEEEYCTYFGELVTENVLERHCKIHLFFTINFKSIICHHPFGKWTIIIVDFLKFQNAYMKRISKHKHTIDGWILLVRFSPHHSAH